MSATLEEIMKLKYDAFVEAAQEILPAEVFSMRNDEGNIDDFNLIEVMDVMLFLFPDDRTKFHLLELCDLKRVTLTEEQIDQLIPIVEKYMKFLKKVKATI